jgi:hypothetical protein
MRSLFCSTITAGLLFCSVTAWGQTSACDLNADGRVDATDVQLAINMSLGVSSCTANVAGSGVCNVVMTQRVINSAQGAACLTGSVHNVSLTWSPSSSPNVTSYNVYRGNSSAGPFTRLTSSPVSATSFNDQNVQSGTTYYYTATAVDNTNTESSQSGQAPAAIPIP